MAKNKNTNWGFKMIRKYWRNDLMASLSVALVALPLAIGIALAAGAPPMAGIVSVVVGGLFTTFFRGGHIAINGPGNTLIVITLSAITLVGGGEDAFSFVMAAFVVSGALQLIMGIFKMGSFGDFFPSSVIQGLLAAIGVIIMSKQLHVALGASDISGSTLQIIEAIPNSLLNLNPLVTIIAIISLAILIAHPIINSKFIRYVPAPIWVLAFTIPLVFLFGFDNKEEIELLGLSLIASPKYLVNLPGELLDGLVFPDFSKWNTAGFWLAVVLINLVTSIETLASAKAVDKIDPLKRKTPLNKDLAAMGGSTILSGFLGGLPVIAVIVRSSVNVNHGGITRWSNFLHGLLLLLMVLLLKPLIEHVPLAALAAILIVAGFKLTAPRVFAEIWRKGWEQMIIFLSTMISTISLGLLSGLLIGMAVALLIQFLTSGLPYQVFFPYMFKPNFHVISENEDNIHFRVHGVINFFNILKLINKLEELPQGKHVVLDFSNTRLVDTTVLESVHEKADQYKKSGGDFNITGLGIHDTSSYHPYSLHILKPPQPLKIKLTKRQSNLKELAADKNCHYDPIIDYKVDDLNEFFFFTTRPVEYKKNEIRGSYEKFKVDWEISDITFDEGDLLETEVHHTTTQFLELPFRIPEFSIEREALIDKLLALAGQKDIDFKKHKNFSNKYSVKGPDEESIVSFFDDKLIQFFENNEVYHLESNGHAVLVFKYLRLASPTEVDKMIKFSEELVGELFDRKEKD